MDVPAILAKITGAVFLALTVRSIIRHVRTVRTQRRLAQKGTEQSVGEEILNNIILYLWLAFATVFSIGMIVNN